MHNALKHFVFDLEQLKLRFTAEYKAGILRVS